METVVLMLQLETWSAFGSLAVTTQEFATAEACQEAGKVAAARFGTVYNRVNWACVGKVSGQDKTANKP